MSGSAPSVRKITADVVKSPALFAHFVVKTAEMEASVSWYAAVLGARIVFRNDILSFMTYDDEHHRIALLKIDPANAVLGSGSIDHVAYAFNNLGDLLSTYTRLKQVNILPVRTINHGPTISFYYRDPQRVMLEFQVDTFDTEEGRAQFFHSDEFAANPIGVIVDADELIGKWEAGVPWEEIRKRPPLPLGKTPWDMREERRG